MSFKSIPEKYLLPTVRDLKEAAVQKHLSQPRQGIMIHFDGSSSDAGGIGWLENKKFNLGYNRVYADNGDIYGMIDINLRAPHAGVCRKTAKIRDPNSAYYGLCALTNERVPFTEEQTMNMLEDARRLYLFHMLPPDNWTIGEISWRVRGHHEEAIYSKSTTPSRPDLWGKLGRKIDPKGITTPPVLDMEQFRLRLATALAKGEVFVPTVQ